MLISEMVLGCCNLEAISYKVWRDESSAQEKKKTNSAEMSRTSFSRVSTMSDLGGPDNKKPGL